MKNILSILIATFSLYGAAAFAHGDDYEFMELMETKQFNVPVSSENLAKMYKASTLLISCVDFRLRDETEKLMSTNLKLLDDYDEIAVPGASLALENREYPHWSNTVFDMIGILKSVHQIRRIILLDHRECETYKLVLGKNHLSSRSLETKTHTEIMIKAKHAIKKKFPDLEVYTLIMGLDGVVEHIKE